MSGVEPGTGQVSKPFGYWLGYREDSRHRPSVEAIDDQVLERNYLRGIKPVCAIQLEYLLEDEE